MKKKYSILEGSLWDALIIFAIPIALSSLLQQLFNAADQAVVGQFAGSEALAAVGANTPVVNLLVNVFSSMSIGANALIARRIGEGHRESINRVVHTSVTFAGAAGLGLMVLGLVSARGLLVLIGTPENVLPMAVTYLRIYCLAFPFVLLYNFGAAILRSIGDTKRPMIALISAGIINVILNLIFVLGLKMGVAGVACATAVSNVISAAAVIYFLVKEQGDLHLSARSLGIDGASLLQILQIGGPAAIQSAVFSVANVCLQSGINSLGSDAIAGSVAASNFEYISFFVTNSFCQAATTFCGQNYGAGQLDRCKRIIRITLGETLIAAAAFDLLCVLARKPLIAFFTADPNVAHYAYERLYIVVGVHFLIALYEIIGASLRSMGYSLGPALLTIIGSVAFRVLWLLTVFEAYPDFKVLMLVYPASWILTAALTWIYYFKVRGRLFGEKGKAVRR